VWIYTNVGGNLAATIGGVTLHNQLCKVTPEIVAECRWQLGVGLTLHQQQCKMTPQMVAAKLPNMW